MTRRDQLPVGPLLWITQQITTAWAPVELVHALITRDLETDELAIVRAILSRQFPEPGPTGGAPVAAVHLHHAGLPLRPTLWVLRRLQRADVLRRVPGTGRGRHARYFVVDDPQRWRRGSRSTMTLAQFIARREELRRENREAAAQGDAG